MDAAKPLKPVPSDLPRVNVYLPHDLKAKLEKLAALNDRPVSNFLVVLIKREIERAEQAGELSQDLPEDEPKKGGKRGKRKDGNP